MLDQRALPHSTPLPSAAIQKLLLVDDDAASRRLLSAVLKGTGFEVTTAGSGEEALAQIASDVPDVVVLDFEMPGLTGDEVCGRIRASADPRCRELPIIMLTAHGGETEEIRCLHAGANDFVTKPVSRAVLQARIETQIRLRALSAALRAQNEELGRWRDAQEADLAAARSTQQAIIPASFPPLNGWSVQTLHRPLIQVGGDLFGWQMLRDGRTMIWLVDATGHGASAALITTLCALLFTHGCEKESQPSAILRAVNREFFDVFQGRSFMTACCAVLADDGTLDFSSAGHPPLIIRRRQGGLETHGPHGTLLGILPDLELEETRTVLADGEVALMHTDGLFSLADADGQRLTGDDVSAQVREVEVGPQFLLQVASGLLKRSNGAPHEDDVAAIACLRGEVAAKTRASPRRSALAGA